MKSLSMQMVASNTFVSYGRRCGLEPMLHVLDLFGLGELFIIPYTATILYGNYVDESTQRLD